jgi:hypothetical protein
VCDACGSSNQIAEEMAWRRMENGGASDEYQCDRRRASEELGVARPGGGFPATYYLTTGCSGRRWRAAAEPGRSTALVAGWGTALKNLISKFSI